MLMSVHQARWTEAQSPSPARAGVYPDTKRGSQPGLRSQLPLILGVGRVRPLREAECRPPSSLLPALDAAAWLEGSWEGDSLLPGDPRAPPTHQRPGVSSTPGLLGLGSPRAHVPSAPCTSASPRASSPRRRIDVRGSHPSGNAGSSRPRDAVQQPCPALVPGHRPHLPLPKTAPSLNHDPYFSSYFFIFKQPHRPTGQRVPVANAHTRGRGPPR